MQCAEGNESDIQLCHIAVQSKFLRLSKIRVQDQIHISIQIWIPKKKV